MYSDYYYFSSHHVHHPEFLSQTRRKKSFPSLSFSLFILYMVHENSNMLIRKLAIAVIYLLLFCCCKKATICYGLHVVFDDDSNYSTYYIVQDIDNNRKLVENDSSLSSSSSSSVPRNPRRERQQQEENNINTKYKKISSIRESSSSSTTAKATTTTFFLGGQIAIFVGGHWCVAGKATTTLSNSSAIFSSSATTSSFTAQPKKRKRRLQKQEEKKDDLQHLRLGEDDVTNISSSTYNATRIMAPIKYSKEVFNDKDHNMKKNSKTQMKPPPSTKETTSTATTKPLLLQKHHNITGFDKVLGSYTGIRLTWGCPLDTNDHHNHLFVKKMTTLSQQGGQTQRYNKKENNMTGSNSTINTSELISLLPVITTVKNFISGRDIVFEIEFPHGAPQTSLPIVVNKKKVQEKTQRAKDIDNNNKNEEHSNTNTSPSINSNLNVHTNTTYSYQDVSTNFPTLKVSNDTILPSLLSWEGSFMQGVHRHSIGSNGGPTIFYNSLDTLLETVIIGSIIWNSNTNKTSYMKSFSSGTGSNWNGTKGYWTPGISGRIQYLPKGFQQSILLHSNSNRMRSGGSTGGGGGTDGITGTLAEWGQIMQKQQPDYVSSLLSQSRKNYHYHRRQQQKNQKNIDVTLTKIGYQTDFGSYYCYCNEKNCSKILIEVIDSLKDIDIPMGYMSFQGKGSSTEEHTKGTARWCVDTWGIDGGLGEQYPLSLFDFQRAIDGIPYQFYASYFCPTSSYYFDNTTIQREYNWTSISSDPSLPECNNFAFRNIHPNQSKEFYTWFLNTTNRNLQKRNKSPLLFSPSSSENKVDMISFEPDHMNQNYNCIPEFIHTVSSIHKWQRGMISGAKENGLYMQWCYTTPTDLLAAVSIEQEIDEGEEDDNFVLSSSSSKLSTSNVVSNFRVSFDYAGGNSWDIGISSLLVWALGKSPSKDTLWTTTNNYTTIPSDHEQPAIELHVLLALMSTGPVGISDGLHMSNATLLKRVISKDGTLLKPLKPITALDSSFLEISSPSSTSNISGTTLLQSQRLPVLDGYVYGTTALGPSWYFVSFKMKHEFIIRVKDFWPGICPKYSNEKKDSFNKKKDIYDIVNKRNHNQTQHNQKSSWFAKSILAYRHFHDNIKCHAGMDAVTSGCVQLVKVNTTSCSHMDDRKTAKDKNDYQSLQDQQQLQLQPIFTIPMSSFTNISGGTDFEPILTTVWQACYESGWIFLGELNKYVAVSPARFTYVSCTTTGIKTEVIGTENEIVFLTALQPIPKRSTRNTTTTIHRKEKKMMSMDNGTIVAVVRHRSRESLSSLNSKTYPRDDNASDWQQQQQQQLRIVEVEVQFQCRGTVVITF